MVNTGAIDQLRRIYNELGLDSDKPNVKGKDATVDKVFFKVVAGNEPNSDRTVKRRGLANYFSRIFKRDEYKVEDCAEKLVKLVVAAKPKDAKDAKMLDDLKKRINVIITNITDKLEEQTYEPGLWQKFKNMFSFSSTIERKKEIADSKIEKLNEVIRDLNNNIIEATSKDEDLFEAIKKENVPIAKIESLIKEGAYVNAKDKEGVSAIHLACAEGNEEVIDLLLRLGADINIKDKHGRTPLVYACVNGQSQVVQKLIDHKSEVNLGDQLYQTPLEYASIRGDLRSVEALLKAGARVDHTDRYNKTALHLACQNGNIEVMKALIEAKANVNAKDIQGMTALHYASLYGNRDATDVLISARAVVNSKDNKGKVPLDYACQKGNTGVIKVLLTKELNMERVGEYVQTAVNSRGAHNKIPLHLACSQGDTELVINLLKAKSEVVVKDDYGRTPLDYACMNGDVQAISELLKAGADGNIVDKFGTTTLIHAVRSGNSRAVDILSKQSSNINVVDHSGRTALDWAVYEGNEDVIRILMNSKYASNVFDERGQPILSADKEKQIKEMLEKRSVNSQITKLHMSCIEGNLEKTLNLIQNGADINAKDVDGNTPLAYAIMRKQWNIVEMLIDKGADVKHANNQHSTPLHLICSIDLANSDDLQRDCMKIISRLLRKGADLKAEDENGYTPLVCAFKAGNMEVVDELLDMAANEGEAVGATKLHWACYYGNAKDVVGCIREQPSDVSFKGLHNTTPLHWVCMKATGQSDKIISALIEGGCDLNAKDTDGKTPLAYACKKNLETAAVLLDNGADPNVPDTHGFTPLHTACYELDVSAVRVLLDHGAALDIRDENGCTPLHYACSRGNEEMIKMLVNKGANIEIEDNDGETPRSLAIENDLEEALGILPGEQVQSEAVSVPHMSLHTACFNGDLEAVKAILDQKGVDVNSVDEHGMTPLSYACQEGRAELVDMIIRAGGNINHAGAEGATPLHLACYSGKLEVIEALMKSNANINAKDSYGRTPLIHACISENDNVDVVKALLTSNNKNVFINSQDTSGMTPLAYACREGKAGTVDVLLKSGAKLDIVDKLGNTPLHQALINRHVDIAKMLIKNGGGENIKNKAGITPLSIADEKGIGYEMIGVNKQVVGEVAAAVAQPESVEAQPKEAPVAAQEALPVGETPTAQAELSNQLVAAAAEAEVDADELIARMTKQQAVSEVEQPKPIEAGLVKLNAEIQGIMLLKQNLTGGHFGKFIDKIFPIAKPLLDNIAQLTTSMENAKQLPQDKLAEFLATTEAQVSQYKKGLEFLEKMKDELPKKFLQTVATTNTKNTKESRLNTMSICYTKNLADKIGNPNKPGLMKNYEDFWEEHGEGKDVAEKGKTRKRFDQSIDFLKNNHKGQANWGKIFDDQQNYLAREDIINDPQKYVYALETLGNHFVNCLEFEHETIFNDFEETFKVEPGTSHQNARVNFRNVKLPEFEKSVTDRRNAMTGSILTVQSTMAQIPPEEHKPVSQKSIPPNDNPPPEEDEEPTSV